MIYVLPNNKLWNYDDLRALKRICTWFSNIAIKHDLISKICIKMCRKSKHTHLRLSTNSLFCTQDFTEEVSHLTNTLIRVLQSTSGKSVKYIPSAYRDWFSSIFVYNLKIFSAKLIKWAFEKWVRAFEKNTIKILDFWHFY